MIISLSREELRRGVASKTGAWATPIDSQRRRSALTDCSRLFALAILSTECSFDGWPATVREALLIPHDFHVGDPRSSTENNGEGRTASSTGALYLHKCPSCPIISFLGTSHAGAGGHQYSTWGHQYSTWSRFLSSFNHFRRRRKV